MTKEQFVEELQGQGVEVVDGDGVPFLIVDEMPSSEKAFREYERAIRDLGYTASFGIRKRRNEDRRG